MGNVSNFTAPSLKYFQKDETIYLFFGYPGNSYWDSL